jgi:hypothetical protein
MSSAAKVERQEATMSEDTGVKLSRWAIGLGAGLLVAALSQMLYAVSEFSSLSTKVEATEKNVEKILLKLDMVSNDVAFIKGQMAGGPRSPETIATPERPLPQRR